MKQPSANGMLVKQTAKEKIMQLGWRHAKLCLLVLRTNKERTVMKQPSQWLAGEKNI